MGSGGGRCWKADHEWGPVSHANSEPDLENSGVSEVLGVG